MNNINLIGNIVRTPELREAGQTTVTNFTIAVQDRFNKEHTDFIRCTAFGKTADLIGNYVNKGDKLAVEGRLQVKNYEHEGVKRTSHDVIVSQITFLTPKVETDTKRRPSTPPPSDDTFDELDDTLPF